MILSILNKIKCMFGHTYDHAFYRGAFPLFTPLMATTDWNGRYQIHPQRYTGFMHYGLCARCKCCGEVTYDKIEGLPILQPEFDKSNGGKPTTKELKADKA